MATKYNEQKIYEELDKLSTNELIVVVEKVKEWARKKGIAEIDEQEKSLNDLKFKIENL